ncbi:hypothetical protein [Phyllobacterium leguminum]|uniref:Uncharacterized protein n=1 Tax=Phyllobacterium leguminum TaxID=314237 RepID=A0A318SYV8_9HYPH|nr:hypothetical protein [Phyllobacterium leguminum]PYE86675.1 hypothetical protein C7477_12140 [Phyllobacterium leguminum]
MSKEQYKSENDIQIPYPIHIPFVLGYPVFRTFLPMEARDEGGRTLLEGRSILYPTDQADYKICPFRDSRHHHEKPMNFGALRYLTENAGSVKMYLSHISALIQKETFPQNNDSISHLLRLGYVGYKAPQPWLLTELHGLPKSLPQEVAVAAKLSQGFIDLGFFANQGDANPPDVQTPEILYAYVDSHGKLIGQKEVCAGPPNMIKHFLASVLNPDDHQKEAFISTDFDMRALIDYSSLAWAADLLALIYNYVRLSSLMGLAGEVDIRSDLRVSFPNSLNIYGIVKSNIRYIDTSFMTYNKKIWHTERTRGVIDEVNKIVGSTYPLVSKNPVEVRINYAVWRDFAEEISRAFGLVNSGINELDILPVRHNNIDVDTLRIFFGPDISDVLPSI